MTRKRHKHKKNKRNATTPLAGRMAQAWMRVAHLEDQVEVLLEQDEDETRMSALLEQVSRVRVQFDDLVCQAHREGHLKRTLSSLMHHLSLPAYADLSAQRMVEMNEAIGGAHQEAWRGARDEHGAPVAVRAMLFGIPVVGDRENAIELANSHFVRAVRQSGWMPELCNVACYGVLSAAEALSLTQDPLLVWRLSDAIYRSNGSDLSLEGVQVPGLTKQQADTNSDEVRVGGYVLLMGAFGPAEHQDYAAVDLPDEQQEELLWERWRVATEQFLLDANLSNPPTVEHPQALVEAARQAMAGQLELTVMLARTMEAGDGDPPSWSQVAFILDPDTGTLDLAALFDDGTQTVLPNALDAGALPIIEDVASRMCCDEPALFVVKGETVPWAMNGGAVLGEDVAHVRPVGGPGAGRRH